MGPSGDFCSYTKAAEHLGDRWMLLILRELGIHGNRGFNQLVSGLPGVSRSVLARRLRKLEVMGLVARDPSGTPSRAPYRLAPAGEQLAPTLLSFAAWADRWVPEDPAAAQHDPDVIAFWLTLRLDAARLPDPAAVVVLDLGGANPMQQWLVLHRGEAPSLCVDDPLLSAERYVFVEADAAALYPVARGLTDWQAAVGNRSVGLFGDPTLIAQLPGWFLPATVAA